MPPIYKGYEPILTMNEGCADDLWRRSPSQEQQATGHRLNGLLQSPPQLNVKITFKILPQYLRRVDSLWDLCDFVEFSPDQKGSHLRGDMGAGKSFMLALWLMNFRNQEGWWRLFITHLLPLMLNGIKGYSVKEQIDAVKRYSFALDDIAYILSSWIRMMFCKSSSSIVWLKSLLLRLIHSFADLFCHPMIVMRWDLAGQTCGWRY